MIPIYTRMGQSIGSGNQLPNKLLMARRALRAREKFLILLLFASLAFVCFGGIFYLPDNFVATDKVREVYKKFQNAGPEIFIPAPPLSHHRHDTSGATANGDDRHIVDRDRLNAKIQGEWADGADILEKPEPKTSSNEAPVMNAPSPEKPNAIAGDTANGVDDNHVNVNGNAVVAAPPIPAVKSVSTTGVVSLTGSSYMNSLPSGEDSDPVTRERRNKIKEVCTIYHISIITRSYIIIIEC